ncbi:cadherin-like beta sandwich domain-containing protein [Clostridium fessum]|uniref:cadherin-like beta sandwich domain-containing protein n=1 Tax=Clostridium fessum TaxID=2126740 RepID=UPI00399F5ADE
MKRFKNIILGILAAGMLTVAAPVGGISAYASSAKISFSDPSATVGQEFSVNVKISSQDGNLGASDVVLSYDPSVIEFVSGNNASGGAGSVRLVGTMDSNSTKAFSYTLKFKAVQAGNTSISVGSYEVYDSDAQAVTVSKTGTASVKVKAPATSSAEAALSSLKISPGTLSPAFSPNVTSYTAQVGASVDKLAVSASAKDSKAKVLVSGDSSLKVGANTVVCKVTAEDGQTTKSYTITVNKLDTVDVPSEAETGAETEAVGTTPVVTNGLDVEIDGVSYTVATEFDASLLPEGYTQSTCTYGGSEVQCGNGNDLTLLYLQGADGNGAFYIYIPESGVLSPYVTIDVTAKSILVLPPDESVQIPDGFMETTIQLNGTYKVQGWVWKSDEQQKYCVVYGMNESGEKSLYRYDIAEKTFQRYFEDPSLATKYDDAQVEEIVDKYNALCRDYNIRFIMLAVLGVACVILFFIVINLLLKRKEWRGEAQAAGGRQRSKRRPPSPNARPAADARVKRGTGRDKRRWGNDAGKTGSAE